VLARTPNNNICVQNGREFDINFSLARYEISNVMTGRKSSVKKQIDIRLDLNDLRSQAHRAASRLNGSAFGNYWPAIVLSNVCRMKIILITAQILILKAIFNFQKSSAHEHQAKKCESYPCVIISIRDGLAPAVVE